MVVRIAGRRMYLWRAVDQEGETLDLPIQPRWDKRAAVRHAQAAQEAGLCA
jgi:transposase-like protein